MPSSTALSRLRTSERLAGMRIRSLAYAAGQWNVETSDLSTCRCQSGPVFTLSGDTWVHMAPGIGTEWLDDSLLYTEASATITLGTVFEGMTQTVTNGDMREWETPADRDLLSGEPGGFGISLIKERASRVFYTRIGDLNHLVIVCEQS